MRLNIKNQDIMNAVIKGQGQEVEGLDQEVMKDIDQEVKKENLGQDQETSIHESQGQDLWKEKESKGQGHLLEIEKIPEDAL